MLGVTPLTLRNWDKNGKLSALRHPINNYRVYRRSEIEKLLAQMGTSPSATPKPASKSSRKLSVKHLD